MTNMNVDFALKEARVLARRYRIESELNQGAASGVYVATDLRDQRTVVLKCFPPAKGQVYLRETKAALEVKHQNLLCASDFFYAEDGASFVVYEYFPNGTASALLPKCRVEDLQQCASDLLAALAHLHSRKLIHCDLKPDNVFLRQTANGIQFVLGDLGSTCTLREAMAGGHRSGTPAYAAPERLHEKFSYNSDLYSLGVMLFQLASGELPFSGGPSEVARAHLHSPVPMERVPASSLRDLIAGLLEKNPTRRYADAQRALSMLNNSTPGQIPERQVGQRLNLDRNGGVQKPIRSERVVEVARRSVEFAFSRVHLLTRLGKPLIVLEGSSEMLLIGGIDASFKKVLPKTGPIRVVSATRLGYIIESNCFVLDLDRSARTVISERCTNVIDYAIGDEFLFTRTNRAISLHHFPSDQESTALASHFLLEAHSVLWEDGQFAISSGSMNNEIATYSAKCALLKSVNLGAPIVKMVAARSALLAVTMASGGVYDLWHVPSIGEPNKVALPSPVRSLCCSPGHVFWLSDGGKVMQSHVALQSRCVASFVDAADGLVVSADHAWLLSWTRIDPLNSRLVLYANGA